MRQRKHFLVWALVNALFVVGLVFGRLSYHQHIGTPALVVAGVTLGLYALAAARIGYLWFDAYEENGRTMPGVTRHDKANLDEAVELFPKVAMIGTICGFLIALPGDTADLQHRVSGAATGLVATLVGLLCMIVLRLQVRHLEQHA